MIYLQISWFFLEIYCSQTFNVKFIMERTTIIYKNINAEYLVITSWENKSKRKVQSTVGKKHKTKASSSP